jgi:triosephosphate isomerase
LGKEYKMRTPIIAGNWKMHKTTAEARALASGIVREVGEVRDVQVVLCPPFTALAVVAEAIKGSRAELGGQNCHYESKGAFTGEVAPEFLADLGCRYVIVGHSERRQYFKEDDQLLNKKLKKAMAAGLIPIFCIGETLEERNKEQTFDVLRRQVTNGLSEIQLDDPLKMVVAYEPVWAIGTGVTATPNKAQEAHRYVRDLLAGLWGSDTAEKVRIQYGGSVKPDNAAELMAQPDIDGALVGGASLEADSFVKIVKFK